jgi:hypothetical protein
MCQANFILTMHDSQSYEQRMNNFLIVLLPFHAIRVDDRFSSIELTLSCKGIRLGGRFWACVDSAGVVSVSLCSLIGR